MEEEKNNEYVDDFNRKARRRRQKLLVKELFLDYAKNTTLHGIPYICKRGLTIVEKIFWLLTFIASVILCGYYISSVWFKWKNSPVLVTVSERLVSVNEVPFPSITICPQTKCITKRYNFTNSVYKFEYNLTSSSGFFRLINYNLTGRINYNLTDNDKKELELYEDICLVCDPKNDICSNFKFLQLREGGNNSIIDNISMVAPHKWGLFRRYYKNRGTYEKLTDSVMKKVLTREGLCYNINSRPIEQIFRSDSLPYLNNTDDTTEPNNFTAQEVGNFPDMELFLFENENKTDQMCNSENSGFRVYVQHPDDLPQASVHYYAVLDKQTSAMALSFSMLNTSDTLERYDPKIRQCYLPNERYLQHFQIYTTSNCNIECLANITLDECKCVGFYMPRFNYTTICTRQRSTCMFDAAVHLEKRESYPETAKCQCFPPCQSVEYEAEILKTDFNYEKFKRASQALLKQKLNLNLDLPETTIKYSKLEIYFKKPHFISMRRSEMFGMIDFLANCGGLLGLFLGFSFLSLVELVYFVTLRLLCTLKKDLEEEKAQTIQVVEEEDVTDKIKY